MVPIGFHLGLRQVVMALMNWAIDVPLELNKVMQYPLYKVKVPVPPLLGVRCFAAYAEAAPAPLRTRTRTCTCSSGVLQRLCSDPYGLRMRGVEYGPGQGNKVELIMKYSYLY